MKRSLTVAFCLLGLLSLSACNDSDTWVDADRDVCKNGKLPSDVTAGGIKLLGPGYCAIRQKSFTGEFQCNGDILQVKCK